MLTLLRCGCRIKLNKRNVASFLIYFAFVPSPQRALINSIENVDDKVKVACKLTGSETQIEMIIDSGAEVNVISEADWLKLKDEYQRDNSFLYDFKAGSDRSIKAYAAPEPLRIIVTFRAWIETTEAQKPRSFAEFHVVKGGGRSLLGRHTAVQMKLLRVGLEVNDVQVKEAPGEGIFPKIPNLQVNFEIDRSVPPVRKAYYHVPAAYTDGARERIEHLLRKGIIERVMRAPRWISGMMAIPKGKYDFRLVLSMIGPNKAILRCFYHLITPEEIRVKLHGARVFTKLDLESAFHHVELGEESREMTTFMTDTGMYRFTRLVFGVTCAPEYFQMIMEKVLEGIHNVVIFIDDILIFSATKQQLQETTNEVLSALARNNLTLNHKKCEYQKQRISFLGHEISEKGLNIEGEKVKVIKTFRSPKSSSELRSFLGLASYLSSYLVNFADLTAPMWKIANTKPFAWTGEAERSFNETKKRIVGCTITQGFFSKTDRTVLYTDASPLALGAVLTQQNEEGEERIISFAAKSLTPTEQRYSQVQREALGIVYGVEHFFFYLLGRRFTVRTDAMGVAYIFKRQKDEAKKVIRRAEGWAMRLAAYDFNIEYVKGNFNIADPPSRLYQGEDEAFNDEPAPMEIAEIKRSDSGEILTPREVAEETIRDETLQKVTAAFSTGDWQNVSNKWKSVKHELEMRDGVLIKGSAAVVPEKLIGKALKIAHKGHPGATAMKSILRSRVWWTGMTRDIEEFVDSCVSCTLTSRANPPVPMIRTALPEMPWDMVAIDYNGPYARFKGIVILVVVDCYSRFLTAALMKSTDFASFKTAMDQIFARNGFPKIMKSDNGPPFNGDEYAKYCADRGIDRVHSTPLYPQQNGMVERYMQVVNKAMQISVHEGSDPEQELSDTIRAHNSATHRVTQAAPEEIMFGRKIRRNLPMMSNARTEIEPTETRRNDSEHKAKSKAREDKKRGARDTAIDVGDTVVIANTKRAKGDPRFAPEKFMVVQKDRGDLQLRAESGRELARNVTQVKKIKGNTESSGRETPPPSKEADLELMPPQQQSRRRNRGGNLEPLRRSERTRVKPKHLDMYVSMLEADRAGKKN